MPPQKGYTGFCSLTFSNKKAPLESAGLIYCGTPTAKRLGIYAI
nr:MAG TPA: hypothetical protein [Caudoviricetes sp.]